MNIKTSIQDRFVLNLAWSTWSYEIAVEVEASLKFDLEKPKVLIHCYDGEVFLSLAPAMGDTHNTTDEVLSMVYHYYIVAKEIRERFSKCM